MTYRIYAQQEIWCVEKGGSRVDKYGAAFVWKEGEHPPPEPPKANVSNMIAMLNRGIHGGSISEGDARNIVKWIEAEVKTDEAHSPLMVNPKHHYATLTALYQVLVVGTAKGIKTGTLNSDDLFTDIYCSKLIW